MSIPRMDVVEPILRPREPHIVRAIVEAWREWKADPHYGLFVWKRTRAVALHEHAVRFLTMGLSDDRGVHPISANETVKFLCDRTVVFRIKKGDSEGRSNNISTQLALDYFDPQACIFGLEEEHRVDICYILNKFETDLLKILVVGRNNSRIIWSYDILGRNAGSIHSVDLFPQTPRPLGPKTGVIGDDGATVVEPGFSSDRE